MSKKNGYPVNFTAFCIKKYLDNLYVKKEQGGQWFLNSLNCS